MQTLNQKLFEIKKKRITLTRDTKAYNYKYATLDQIQDKINPILEEMQLLVTHSIQDGCLTTTITNIEKESESIFSSIPLSSSTKAQDKGSEITYYRRYNLVSLLDLEVEDDDGAKASKEKYVFGQEQLDKFKKDRNKHKEKLTTYEKAMKMIEGANYTISDGISLLLKQFYAEQTS